MKGNIKKIIALFLIVILNAHNISFSLEENTQNKEIQNTIEEIKDSQESTEKKFAQIVGKADTIIADYKQQVVAKGEDYVQQNATSIKNTLTKASNLKLKLIDVANEVLKKDLDEKIEAQLEDKVSADTLEQIKQNTEPNYLFELQDAPTDPFFGSQWGLQNIVSGNYGDKLQYNGDKVTVAVIDTGINFSTPDLAGKEWKRDTCLDAEGKQIPEGCQKGGYDFVDNDNNPFPDDNYSHGTQVAGIIGANTNNNQGIASLANQNVEIMSLRACCGQGNFFGAENIAKAIRFATNNHADIINASFGGPTDSQVIQDAIEYANTKGVTIVAAAGNYSSNNDITPIYPANYNVSNIISVGSINSNETLSSFSNYGKNNVDIAAPGSAIYSTDKDGNYQAVNGTSFATPFVTSTLARYKSQNQNFGIQSLRNTLLTYSQANTKLAGTINNGKQLKYAPIINALAMNTEQKVAVSATAEDKPTVLLGNAGYSMSSGTQLQSTGKVLFEPQTFIPQGIRQEETRIKTQDVESIDLNDPKNKGFTLEEIKMIQKYAIPAEKENLEGWAVADDKDKKSAVAELALARDDDFLEITFVFKDHADGEMVQNLINTYHISKINNFGYAGPGVSGYFGPDNNDYTDIAKVFTSGSFRQEEIRGELEGIKAGIEMEKNGEKFAVFRNGNETYEEAHIRDAKEREESHKISMKHLYQMYHYGIVAKSITFEIQKKDIPIFLKGVSGDIGKVINHTLWEELQKKNSQLSVPLNQSNISDATFFGPIGGLSDQISIQTSNLPLISSWAPAATSLHYDFHKVPSGGTGSITSYFYWDDHIGFVLENGGYEHEIRVNSKNFIDCIDRYKVIYPIKRDNETLPDIISYFECGGKSLKFFSSDNTEDVSKLKWYIDTRYNDTNTIFTIGIQNASLLKNNRVYIVTADVEKIGDDTNVKMELLNEITHYVNASDGNKNNAFCTGMKFFMGEGAACMFKTDSTLLYSEPVTFQPTDVTRTPLVGVDTNIKIQEPIRTAFSRYYTSYIGIDKIKDKLYNKLGRPFAEQFSTSFAGTEYVQTYDGIPLQTFYQNHIDDRYGNGHSAIVMGPNNTQAYAVKGDFWKKYKEVGFTKMGRPISEEQSFSKENLLYTKTMQKFENGCFVGDPNFPVEVITPLESCTKLENLSTSFSITGPSQVNENINTAYSIIDSNGNSLTSDYQVQWKTNNTTHTISSNGTLTTKSVPGDQKVTITAYINIKKLGITKTVQKDVTIKNSASNDANLETTYSEIVGVEIDKNTNEIKFLSRSRAAKPGEKIINLETQKQKFKKIFLQSLTIPNYKQYVSLDITQNGGKARVESPFENTDMVDTMFDADLLMKHDLFGKSNLVDFGEMWTQLVQQSPYWPQLNAQGFTTYPYWIIAGMIQPGKVTSHETPNSIFLEDIQLDVRTGRWISVPYLDLSRYNLTPAMKADLDTRLAQFKTNLENIVNNYAVSTLIPYMNSPNTDERYAKMKAIFTAMAVAQWYKQKTNNNPTLPYSAIVDTQQMDNISREGTFDRSYWDNQAFNTIVRKPGIGFWGSGEFWIYGGINFQNSTPQNIGNLTAEQTQIFASTAQYDIVQKADQYYTFGGSIPADKPDLTLRSFIPAEDAQVVGNNNRFNVEISNKGLQKAETIKVKLIDTLKDRQGNEFSFTLGEQIIPSLMPDESKNLIFTWKLPETPGIHTLSTVIDPENTLSEADETNNTFVYNFESVLATEVLADPKMQSGNFEFPPITISYILNLQEFKINFILLGYRVSFGIQM